MISINGLFLLTQLATFGPVCGNAQLPTQADLQAESDPQLRATLRDLVVSLEPIFDQHSKRRVVIRAFDRLHRLVRGRRHSATQISNRFNAFEAALAQSQLQLDPCTLQRLDAMRLTVAELVIREVAMPQAQPAGPNDQDDDDDDDDQ